jgi:hypothetical protein
MGRASKGARRRQFRNDRLHRPARSRRMDAWPRSGHSYVDPARHLVLCETGRRFRFFDSVEPGTTQRRDVHHSIWRCDGVLRCSRATRSKPMSMPRTLILLSSSNSVRLSRNGSGRAVPVSCGAGERSKSRQSRTFRFVRSHTLANLGVCLLARENTCPKAGGRALSPGAKQRGRPRLPSRPPPVPQLFAREYASAATTCSHEANVPASSTERRPNARRRPAKGHARRPIGTRRPTT